MNDKGYVEAGRFIKKRREELGITQAELVEHLARLNIATSEQALSRIENGNGNKASFGDAQFINAISQILRFSPEELLFLTGHLRRSPLRVETYSQQRILEMTSRLSPTGLETAEQIIEIILSQESKTKNN